MLPAKKRLWIEILLHLVFWAGAFYVLTSLDRSHIHVWAKSAHIVRDRVKESAISSYIYIILILLMALFYGNVFWVFPKVIRHKKSIAQIAVCLVWFTTVFGANYLIVGPLFDEANPVPGPSAFLLNAKRDSLSKIIFDHPPNFSHSNPD